MNISLRSTALLAGLVTFGLPAAASASVGGVRVVVQEWVPTNPSAQTDDVVLDKPGLLSDALNAGWAQARVPACKAMMDEAGQGDLLGSGFTLYDMDCQLAQSGTLDVTSAAPNTVTLVYDLPGNMFKGTTTQPAVGKWGDPCFYLYYDLHAKTTLHLDTLDVDAFSVSIDNVSRPQSCNTAGDVARWAATTFHFFGGKDFLAVAQDSLTRTQNVSTSGLNSAVESFMQPVRQYSSQYASQQNIVSNGNLAFVFSPKYVPQPANATIGGTIDIPKATWKAGTPDCGIYGLTATVQTGPAPIDPFTLRRGTAPTLDLGSLSVGGTANDAGDRFTCAYRENALPDGVPVVFHGSAKRVGGDTSDPKAVYLVSMVPEGWSGTAVPGTVSTENYSSMTSGNVADIYTRNVSVLQVPVKNAPASTYVNPVVVQNPTALQNPAAIADQSLNPQPLPPAAGDTLVASGNALFARGDFAGAATAFRRAYAADARNAVALHNLALANAKLGNAGLAKTQLQQASTLSTHLNAGSTVAPRSIIIVGGMHQ